MRYPTAHEIDIGAMPMVLAMAKAGLPADRDHFRALASDFSLEMAKIQHQVEQYAGGYVNLASHPQVSKLLYGKLGLAKPAIRGKKSGATMTGDDLLAQMVGLHPVPQLVRDYRGYDKLLNTYIRPMYTRHIKPDGRVYPIFRITSTDTGRLSAADPNIMAQPVRSAEGRKIRRGYKPKKGRVILSIDFSGIEMRVVAWQSGDRTMIKVFLDGEDIHTQTAALMFGIPVEQVDEKKHRYPAKRIAFLILYGGGAEGLHRLLIIEGIEGWDLKRCQWAIDRWFEVYSDVSAYMADVGAFAIRHGYVEDFVGRRRLVPGAQLKDERLRARAIRQAGNQPIQSGAQELIKMAMGKIQPVVNDWQAEGYYVVPLCQVHDELVFECQEAIVHSFAAECQGIMENIVETSTGLKTDAEYSAKSWGDLEALWN